METLHHITCFPSPSYSFPTSHHSFVCTPIYPISRFPLFPKASLFSANANQNPGTNHNPNLNKQMKVNADESGRMLLANSNTSYIADVNSGSSFIIRPLAEILRDLNKKVPDQVLKEGTENQKYIPWYQANRLLSFYAPGWCGEVRDITFSADGNFVTVIYRVTIRGSDGEVFREALGTMTTSGSQMGDPTQKAEAMAFVRACARFGLGLYLHHSESI